MPNTHTQRTNKAIQQADNLDADLKNYTVLKDIALSLAAIADVLSEKIRQK